MSAVCSRRPSFPSAGPDLFHGPLNLLAEHFGRLVPALRHKFPIGQFGVVGLSESTMTERRERQFIAQPGRPPLSPCGSYG